MSRVFTVGMLPVFVKRVVSLVVLVLFVSQALAQSAHTSTAPCNHAASAGIDLLESLAVYVRKSSASFVPQQRDVPTSLSSKVNVVYLLPSDKALNPLYFEALQRVASDIRLWFANQTWGSRTFRYAVPGVRVVNLPHSSSWYAKNPRPKIFTQFWDNVLSDALPLTGGAFDDAENIWVYYIDADTDCGQCGGCGHSGILLVSANDLRGIANESSLYDPCKQAQVPPEPNTPNRWIGGLGHELGHAFGLPHPPGCDSGEPQCDHKSLMWNGFRAYKNTYLRDAEKAILATSPFFNSVVTSYAASAVSGRMVAGDFNGDRVSDVAALSGDGKGNARIDVWLSTGKSFGYQASAPGWWTGTGYGVDAVTDRVVAGDFNGDQVADVAALYDYGNGETRIHIWLSTRTRFEYQGSTGWWIGKGYTAAAVKGRVVAGDFDGDLVSDIAALYDYGAGETRIHVWISTRAGFEYQGSTPGWWSATGYEARAVTGRVVAGDFDADGDADIAALHDYGGAKTHIHVWLSTRKAFDYKSPAGWWMGTGYAASAVTSRVIAGDFNGDRAWDVSAMYDYGGGETRIHVWLSNRVTFQYQESTPGWWAGDGYSAHAVTARVVAGDFDGDRDSDIGAMYDYGAGEARMHVWLATPTAFWYPGSTPGWWWSLDYPAASLATPPAGK